MYRSLGRLFLQIDKKQCIMELNENKKTLLEESKKYEDLRTTYQQKQEHFKSQLDDISKKKWALDNIYSTGFVIFVESKIGNLKKNGHQIWYFEIFGLKHCLNSIFKNVGNS